MTKMKFIGMLNGKTHHIEVDDHDLQDDSYTITLDGVPHTLDAQALPSEIVTALIDNKSYDIDLDKGAKPANPLDGSLAVRVRGRVIRLEMYDERRYKMKEAQNEHFAQGSSSKIFAPMPGKVLRILVKAGETVKQGQGLLVLEAMKMENELQAPKDGVIADIFVTLGQAVESGAQLLMLE